MLYFVSGVLIVVLCLVGIIFVKHDKVSRGLFIAILIIIAIPFILSHFMTEQNSVKYFKCTRCGEICTATENEYKYDASRQQYYIEHDCPRYVPNINIYEIDKKDALKELKLKDNTTVK